MECKFCHEIIEDDAKVCPVCDADLTEEENTAQEDVLAEETPVTGGEKKSSTMLLWGIIIGVVAALALVLAFFLWPQNTKHRTKGEVTLTGMQSFTVTAAEMTEKRGDVKVATMGVANKLNWLTDKDTLTNAELALYYWDTFYSFYENYYYYMSMLGLDPLHMDTTACTMAEGQSWQEYFLGHALTRYRDQTAVLKLAKAEGFTLSEEAQKTYDENVKAIRESADIADAIYETYGPGITLEDYLQYWEDQYYYSVYVTELMDTVEYTDDALSAYYDSHKADYESINVQKLDSPVVHVRHILLMPVDDTVEADWTAAEQKAQQVYNTWLSGEKTEESFAALAKEHSGDGNAAQGGLYENVYPGQMVAEFQDWCFDETRKPGDTGIVETEFGYHIMYYVGQGEHIYWKEVVRADYVSEETNNRINAIAAEYTIEYDTGKIALSLPGQIADTQ